MNRNDSEESLQFNIEIRVISFHPDSVVDPLYFSVTDEFFLFFITTPTLFQRDGEIIVGQCNLVFSLTYKNKNKKKHDYSKGRF